MNVKAAITVFRPREEVERLWQSSEHRPEYLRGADAVVTFTDAPGDRGTEIRVDLEQSAPGGKVGELVKKVAGSDPRAKLMDDLRRFKQHTETGEIARSDATPGGESIEAKRDQRPGQPLEDAELEQAGIR